MRYQYGPLLSTSPDHRPCYDLHPGILPLRYWSQSDTLLVLFIASKEVICEDPLTNDQKGVLFEVTFGPDLGPFLGPFWGPKCQLKMKTRLSNNSPFVQTLFRVNARFSYSGI